jgi:hypothetical protein
MELIPIHTGNLDMALAVSRQRERQIPFHRLQCRLAMQMLMKILNLLRES